MTIKPDNQFSSPIQIEALVGRLEQRQALLQDQNIKGRLGQPVSDQTDQQLLKELRLLGVSVDLDDAQAVKQTLALIRQWLELAPVVHLTFSAMLDSADRSAIVDWFHAEISPSVLVDFRVDSHLAAGFGLRTKNRIYDYSGNDRLWQNRAQLSELVKHV